MIQSIERLYSNSTMAMKHSFIREILKITKGVPGMISFAGGLPNPKSFPKELLAELFEQVIKDEGDEALQYGASEGDKIFKDAIKVFEEVPYPTEFNEQAIIGLRRHKSPWTWMLKIGFEPGLRPDSADPFWSGVRNLGPDRLKERLQQLTLEARRVRESWQRLSE